MSTYINKETKNLNNPGPLLTICIPSYNKSSYLEAQIVTIIANILNYTRYDVELVIVNNKSTDDTELMLSKYSHSKMKIINRDKHYDTAEESLMRSLEYASGKYIWFLGDDDPIHINNFDYIINLLLFEACDCYIFNSTLISGEGEIKFLRPMPMNGEKITGSISSIIESIGLINTFAGISNLIQKKSNLILAEGLGWLKLSKIYSHVSWFVSANRHKVVSFVNVPIVNYRINEYADNHWGRVAEKFQVPDLYFWSLGLVRLLTKIVESDILSYQQVGNIFELALGGARYRLIDDILFKTYSQIMTSVKYSSDKRQQFSISEMSEIMNFLNRSDPTLFNITRLLTESHEVLNKINVIDLSDTISARMESVFMDLYQKRQASGQFGSRFIGLYHDCELYRLPFNFVAIRSGLPTYRADVLSYTDPIGDDIDSFDALSVNILIDKIVTANRAKRRQQQRLTEMTTIAKSVGVIIYNNENNQNYAPIIEQALNQMEGMRIQIDELQKSKSWAITAPLRLLAALFKRRKA